MVILVTGASGQLGQAIRSVSAEFPEIVFHFANSSEIDISNLEQIRDAFERISPNFCINAAAYTAVDKSESEPEKAREINVKGAANLASVCLEKNSTLIHVSTDFIFDGLASEPYSEESPANPTGTYGLTKRDGEIEVQKILDRHFIVRTSWVYSEFANNFMKTMLRLASERDEISVVNDQIGTPTYAIDLARALVEIAQSGKTVYGIYNFSNEGVASWYDFAREIFDRTQSKVVLKPIPTSSFPTPAKRPAYSVLDKSRIKSVFGLKIRPWQDALAESLSKFTS
ncbi:dTDP-4-dehydrorhamnose reductase [Flavobacterium selenitireducens]|uniref:dTDP-4-dehydrorhamnose reductase n=1 Tax=Flavobacterium selenitireducens TaxID=2722704 RepID=UPI00168AFFBC|nr:dTDP-4-dehydrorhamnose reductase [Flavobacterium selenitireducens]MBD3583779.1 dTDP-4-dehydrorhamnose reductase [Flavobacterium selenitireducens]